MTTKLNPIPFDKTAAANEIPKDLAAQMQSLRAFVSIHDLLMAGSFQAVEFNKVAQGIKFLEDLHGHAMELALTHESADLVADLKAEKNRRIEAAKAAPVAEAPNAQT